MRTVQTFRDVEIIINRILDDLELLKKTAGRVGDLSRFVERGNLPSIIQSFNTQARDPKLIDLLSEFESNRDLNLVIHSLDHQFNRININGLKIRDLNDRVGGDYWEWLSIIGGSPSNKQLALVDPTGAAIIAINTEILGVAVSQFIAELSLIPATTNLHDLGTGTSRWRALYIVGFDITGNFTGHLIPSLNNSYDVGSSSNRIKKIWAVDIDISGTATGFPGGTVNNVKEGACSSSLVVTTSYTDVSGCSISLDQNGTWLVIATCNITKDAGDIAITVQLDYDGTPQTGVVGLDAASATVVNASVAFSWIIVVTSQPKTAKLQGKKASGSGASFVASFFSKITGIFIKT